MMVEEISQQHSPARDIGCCRRQDEEEDENISTEDGREKRRGRSE
jgi:hypothetical protein